MRLSRKHTVFPALLAALAVLTFAGPAFAHGSSGRQAVQAACVNGFHQAGQARSVRMPDGDVVDGDVVDGKRLRVIGARRIVVNARSQKRLRRYGRLELRRYIG